MNDDPLLWLLLLQLVFICLNAIFACAEIAVITMNDNKLAKLTAAGDKRALRLTKLTEQPAGFLATIQVGITLVNLLSSAVATENFSDRLVAWFVHMGINIPASVINILSVAIITVLLTYFTVLLGELIPKRLAMKKAEQIALGMSGLIYAVSKIFTPAVWLFTVSTNGLLRLLGVDPNSKEDENAEEEIRMILDAGKQKGTIQPDEQSMIQNIFEFDDISAGEIMTHRTEVSLLWLDETDEEWEQTINESRHSIYPVCSESPDHIIGVLYMKDYLRLKNKNRDNAMKRAVQSAYFIPESVRADVLFRNMKKSRNHFAVVVDEYGGMSGIVTMNDLLEQLVGDLDDDITEPPEKPLIERIDSKTWRIQGMAPLDEVSTQLGVMLPDEEHDTFGGLVFGLIGSVPSDGSTPELEEYGLTIKVTKIKDRRLESAVVCQSDAEPSSTNK
ncbi:putative hemolysin [Ruminiclostridium sufflavum DSM 19573]|uniref:Putative hemolysin n=1 Tax=Ruminiclostridium sufflavum DSM 19573 TaxID=1121337 RepID=A0A318Y2G2_9FIRM|nr:hemolysin family protein [Ruminiclostridium sufflavum]PYG89737.1 putative hemolysin [Ruminiclostridium sufflavum DSM 19573]